MKAKNITEVFNNIKTPQDLIDFLNGETQELQQQIVDAECVIRALEGEKKDWFARNIYWDKYKERR